MFLFFALHVQRLRLDLLFDVTGQAFVFIVLVPEWLSCLRLLLLNFLGPGISCFLLLLYWSDYRTMTVSVGNDFQKWDLRGCYMIRTGCSGYSRCLDKSTKSLGIVYHWHLQVYAHAHLHASAGPRI